MRQWRKEQRKFWFGEGLLTHHLLEQGSQEKIALAYQAVVVYKHIIMVLFTFYEDKTIFV